MCGKRKIDRTLVMTISTVGSVSMQKRQTERWTNFVSHTCGPPLRRVPNTPCQLHATTSDPLTVGLYQPPVFYLTVDGVHGDVGGLGVGGTAGVGARVGRRHPADVQTVGTRCTCVQRYGNGMYCKTTIRIPIRNLVCSPAYALTRCINSRNTHVWIHVHAYSDTISIFISFLCPCPLYAGHKKEWWQRVRRSALPFPCDLITLITYHKHQKRDGHSLTMRYITYIKLFMHIYLHLFIDFLLATTCTEALNYADLQDASLFIPLGSGKTPKNDGVLRYLLVGPAESENLRLPPSCSPLPALWTGRPGSQRELSLGIEWALCIRCDNW